MTASSYTSEPFCRPNRNLPLGDWLMARNAQHEALVTMLGTSEAEATEWLAAKPDLKTMKRDTYKDECMRIFGISGRAYRLRVRPVARKLAGLPKNPRSGPKKQIKK